MFVKVNATLASDAASLQKLDGLTATLWDADPVRDDQLSTAVLRGGRAEFLIDLEDASSPDSPLETQPDLFLTVADRSGTVVFRSGTLPNVDFCRRDPVSGDPLTTLDLVFSAR